MSRLENPTAIVTGASAGIGAATARLLAARGARLVLNARREERLVELAESLGAKAVPGDVTDPFVRAAILEACEGRVAILVNNAGYGEPGPVETVGEEALRRQFEVNFFAAAAMMRAVLPWMRRDRFGRILNVSSVAGRFGYPLFGWYCASKHALEGLSDALRLEAAPWGVRVVLIEPGPVLTEFFEVTRTRAAPQMEDAESAYRPFFADVDAVEREVLKQAVSPERVAAIIAKACFAARPKARYAVSLMSKVSLLSLRLFPRGLLDAMIRRQFHVPGPRDVE